MSTGQTDEEFNFRVVLIKIQNSLSDSDRKQLNFLFNEDIQRCLQNDSSLDGAMEILQTLFDRLKISKDDFGYLDRALRAIERHDCAQRLQGKVLKIIECNRNKIIFTLDYKKLVAPVPLIELALDENATAHELSKDVLPKPPTASEMIAAFDEEDDSMSLPSELIIRISHLPIIFSRRDRSCTHCIQSS
jgi:hypothetical protein